MSSRSFVLRSQLFGTLLALSTIAATQVAGSGRQQLKSADAAFHAGYAAAQSGDLATAREQFEKVIRLAPAIAEGHSALGSVLLQLGQYQEAIPELVSALGLKPDDRSAQLNLAIAYERSSDHGKALHLFRLLERNAPSSLSPSDTVFYARALAATQQSKLAITKLRSAVAVAPQNPLLHDTLGSLEAQQQDFVE